MHILNQTFQLERMSQVYRDRHADELRPQVPNKPLLGPHRFDRLLENIVQAIEDEATAAKFYFQLLGEAPDPLHERFIRHAYEDELEHLQIFEQLYIHFTGRDPRYTARSVDYDTYHEGLLLALEDELEAAEFYRDVQLSTTDQLVRDSFYFAMVDELEHATMFSVLYGDTDDGGR